jgi:hypothetical protein
VDSNFLKFQISLGSIYSGPSKGFLIVLHILINRAGEKMEQTARLIVNGMSYELPLIVGSEGEMALDISSLRQETGLITLDPGYANTGSCKSSITFMDGERGILRYRNNLRNTPAFGRPHTF